MNNKHNRRIPVLISAGLFLAGIICLCLKAFSKSYIDATGVLHENFYLLPVGFALVSVGLLFSVISLIVMKKSYKQKDN